MLRRSKKKKWEGGGVAGWKVGCCYYKAGKRCRDLSSRVLSVSSKNTRLSFDCDPTAAPGINTPKISHDISFTSERGCQERDRAEKFSTSPQLCGLGTTLVFLRRCIFSERLCKHIVFPLRASESPLVNAEIHVQSSNGCVRVWLGSTGSNEGGDVIETRP